MSNVTQTIPSYIAGISQQPDEFKVPGQVNIATNVFPDITEGLSKRPGTRFIKQLDAAGAATDSQDQGKWFHYYRDETEQYLGQISRTGDINMWKCSDGSPVTVNSSGNSSAMATYLTHTADQDIQTLTLNDYTYLTNRTKTTAMSSTTEATRPPEAFIELKKVAYARQYAVNIFDDTSTQEVKTATRIKVASASLDSDSSCPNVATEIFKVGTDDQDLTNVKQRIKISLATIGETSANNFFEDDATRAYSLIYVPPAFSLNTYYQTGDLIQGESDNSRIYKRTGADITYISGSAPSHNSGETNGWTALTTNTYSANSDVASTQLYEGQACIEIADSREIDSKADLDLTVAAWAAGNGAHFPFQIDGTTWDGEFATLTYVWKNIGDYSNHISRIILRRTDGTTHTIGGNNVSSASDGALSTSNGKIAVSRVGWGGQDVLAAGRAGLYFRLTNTGQAVPDATGDNYSCRYTTTVDLLHGGSGWEPGDKIQIRMKDGVYILEVEETSTANVQANLGLVRPTPTSFDTKTVVTAESILGDIQTGCTVPQSITLPTSNIDATSGEITVTGHGSVNGDAVKYYSNGGTNLQWGTNVVADGTTLYIKDATENTFKLGTSSGTGGSNIVFSGSGNTGNNNQYITKDFEVSLIGNGLYIKGVSNFNIATPVNELLNVLTDSIKDIGDLPNQCKHGYVVKVANSDAEEDDYYVKFFGHNDRDGEGIWEECAKPGTNIAFDAGTMPLQMVRQANGTFTLSTVTWDNAQVGDTSVDGTNPQPSFIGNTINKMMFFRNRLVLLSDENVIMSRPGDFTNFWSKSAITFTATDPIDISCSSEYPAIIYDGIQVNSGLVLFTKNQQFMLTTDSDVLSPLTAKINFISAYNFNHNTNPFSLGTTIGFIDNVGQHSRLMEMARVLREGEPDVIEQSKVVSELLDKDLNIVSTSKENGFVALSEKDKTTLYCYKFFNTSDKRVHQAWFTWSFHWDIQYHFIIDDSLYLVLDDDGKCMLIKLDLKLHSDTLQTYTGTSTDKENTHPVYLDCATEVAINDYMPTTPDATGRSWTRANNSNATTIINYTNHGYIAGQLVKVYLGQTVTLAVSANNLTANSFQVYGGNLYIGTSGTTDVTGQHLHYNASTNKTTFPLPTNWWTTEAAGGDMVLYETGGTDPVGRYTEVTINGSNVVVDGNWEGTTVVLGILYEMEVEFPKIYPTSQQGESVRSDTRGSLVLHRNKINLGASGLYQTILKRRGKPTFTEDHESVIADYSEESELPTQQLQIKVIPIYDRNTNTTLTLKSKHPTPLTLFSMTWEGDYTNKFYSSV